MLQLWLALLFFVIQTYQSGEGERRLVEHVDQKLAETTRTIIEQIEERLVPPPGTAEQMAVVVRRLNVRIAPDKRAQRLDILEPGQKVNVLGRAEAWLEVEYFDYRTAAIKKGWIAARFTKAVTVE